MSVGQNITTIQDGGRHDGKRLDPQGGYPKNEYACSAEAVQVVKQRHFAQLPRENDLERVTDFGHLFLDDVFTLNFCRDFHRGLMSAVWPIAA